MLILALDLGTSSMRSALFDARGTRVAGTTAQRTYRLTTDASGRAELDPVEMLAAFVACIGETLAARAADPALSARPIAAVGTSCFWHSLVGVDADGDPLTPIVTWADSRCRAEAEGLRKRLDERAVHARTGCMLRASFWPAKLRWLARTQGKTFARVASWMSPAEWLYLRLLGLRPDQGRCAHGMASATGLYDPAKRVWDAGMLRACHIRAAQLPTVSDEALPAADCRFAELRAAAWIPAIGDGAANNLGAGATRPGTAAINFGTSGAVRVLRHGGTPRAPYGLFCYRVDARRVLVGGAITPAGGLRAWGLEHLRLPAGAELEQAMAARPGPAHGLRVLPFWMAERAPTWREDLAGAIDGISQATTALDLYQAITEATYHRLATIIERIPGDTRRLRFLVGGGIQQSPSAFQRLADVIGRTLVACDEPETSLRGAAVLAIERLGKRPAAIGGTVVRPRARWAKAYALERTRLAQLEDALYG